MTLTPRKQPLSRKNFENVSIAGVVSEFVVRDLPMLSVVALGAVCEVRKDDVTAYADQLVHEFPVVGAQPSPYHPDLPIREDPDGSKPMARSFCLTEFADLSDGRRVILRDDGGFSGAPMAVDWDPDTGEVRDASWQPGTKFESLIGDQWRFTTGQSLTGDVIATLDPDGRQEWYDWVVDRLRTLGIEVDPGSVVTAPYQVEFGSRVLEELQKRGR